MNLWEAIRIQALQSVMKSSAEYEIRKLFRWYSKTFHTPLKEVEDLPLEQIVRDYWESQYENMDEGELEYAITALVTDEHERLCQEEAEAEEVQRLLEEAAKDNEVVQKKQAEPPPPPPSISMTFVDDNLSEEDLEKFNTMNVA